MANVSNDQATNIALQAISMYNTWGAMNGRCKNPLDRAFEHYGGRGITVEWDTFEQFFRDMYPTYKIGLTLDRKNNDGNYSYSNCRWATAKEQANNRRTNRFITLNGVTKTTVQWCEELGIRPGTVNQRIHVYGWSNEKALLKPVEPRGKGVCANGHPFDKATKRKDNKGYSCRICRKFNMKVRI